MLSIPIVIVSFNRPDYLDATLRSLAAQRGVDLSRSRIFLFQDGATNPYSGISYCDEATIATNVTLFRQILPHGIAIPASRNLGIALNFDRAERFVFEELGVSAAIFLEDDLALGPYYLKTLLGMIGLALGDERVGYVAAYGNHRASVAEQLRDPRALTLMGHNWGFGLTRRQWLRQKPYVDQYLDILRGADYRRRDHDRIIDLFHSWGLGVPGTSQDIAKSHAVILTNAAKVNTFACFGRYIGEHGVHFAPDQFAQMGFGETFVVQDDIFEAVPPSQDVLTRFIDIARHSAMVEAVRRSRPPAPKRMPATPPAPDSTEAAELVERLRACSLQGKFDEAAQLCALGLSTFPAYRDRFGHPAFLKESVRLALDRGDVEQADIWSIELGARIGPRDPCVHILKGRYYFRIGDIAGVRREAQAVLALVAEHQEAHTWLARLDRLEQPSTGR